MKKLLVLLIVAVLLCGMAFADDSMSVKPIGKDSSSSTVSLDDLKLNVAVTVEGYGILKATSFEYRDWLGYYMEGYNNAYYSEKHRYTTGTEADFAMLRMDITNRSTKAKNFLQNVKVKVVFEDYYEYEGWCYQYNYDNVAYDGYYFDSKIDRNKQNTEWVIAKKDNFAINPMYTGHYVFGCTLPTAVIESRSPLRMEISIDGNEIIYNIRK